MPKKISISDVDLQTLRKAFESTWDAIAHDALAAMNDGEEKTTNQDCLEMSCDYLDMHGGRAARDVLDSLVNTYDYGRVMSFLSKKIQLL